MWTRIAQSALLAVPLLAAAPSRAADYTWSYSDPQHSGSGTLTVTGSSVTAISGTWDGNGIIQLITDGSCCGAPGADNAFNAAGNPFLSSNGMAFQTFGNPGFYDILWNAGSNAYSVLDSNGLFTSNGSFTATPKLGGTRVPEPASLAMMAVALAGLGAATRRRSAAA